jgi:hypothetical protein
MAIRDDTYKLVRKQITDFSVGTGNCVTTDYTEFYAIDEAVPPRLDNARDDLLDGGTPLTAAKRRRVRRLAFERLKR